MRLNIIRSTIFSILLIQAIVTYSQVRVKADAIPVIRKNAICFTFLGTAVFYSLNYQRQLISNNRFMTIADIGIAYYPRATNPKDIIVFQNWLPISIIENVKLYKHHYMNIGIGKTFIYDEIIKQKYSSAWLTATNFIIGYRFQKGNQRFFEELNYIVILPHYGYLGPANWGSIKVGYCFW